MVDRLLGSGRPVVLHARKDEVRTRFAALGATIVDSPQEVAERSRVIVLVPFDSEQLDSMLHGHRGLLSALESASVVVQHGTVSVDALRAAARAVAKRGAQLVDGPISGRVEDIEAGELTVLAGGSQEAVARAADIVSAYASTVIETGPVGTATFVKLVNNLVFAANAQSSAAAVRLGQQLGIAPEALLAALEASSGRSYAGSVMRQVGGTEPFEQAAAPYLRKDVEVAVHSAGSQRADPCWFTSMLQSGPLCLTTSGTDVSADASPSRPTGGGAHP